MNLNVKIELSEEQMDFLMKQYFSMERRIKLVQGRVRKLEKGVKKVPKVRVPKSKAPEKM